MPKVTLLGPAYKTYDVIFGKATYEFKGGKPLEVPPAVAIFCDKLKVKGRKAFQVEQMPEVVTPAKPSSKEVTVDEQNVVGDSEETEEEIILELDDSMTQPALPKLEDE